jgi:hypothetical protein
MPFIFSIKKKLNNLAGLRTDSKIMGAVTVGCCSGNGSGLALKETSQKKEL